MISLVLPDHFRWESWIAAIDEFSGAALHGFSTLGFDARELHQLQIFTSWLQRDIRERTGDAMLLADGGPQHRGPRTYTPLCGVPASSHWSDVTSGCSSQ